tara:strand:+ start:23793 stop:24797 length:1005 start_codon:yes stop_codon:yes gene_type:complete
MSYLKNMALIGASLLFVFAVGEVAIRALVSVGFMDPLGGENLIQGAQKSDYDIHNAGIRKSSNPILSFEYDPSDPNINSLGLRGKETTIDKPADVYRIALLGDSFTYGFSVALSDIFATRLETRLNEKSQDKRYEILNFGRRGYGTVQEAELYRTFIRQFDPDEVLLSYVLNDVTDYAFLVELIQADVWFKTTTKQLSQKSLFATWIYLSYHRALQSQTSDELWKLMYTKSAPRFLKVQQALAELSDMTQQDGVKLRAVIFPELGANAGSYPYTAEHNLVKATLLENGIDTRDLLADYEQYKDWTQLIVSTKDQHPNSKGHAIATTAIYEFLVN